LRTQYYGEIKVDWTDGEWSRLREIKDNPDRVHTGRPAKVEGKNEIRLAVYFPEWLKRRIDLYAKDKGVSTSRLIRDVMYVFTC
jgi:hypothetical protein